MAVKKKKTSPPKKVVKKKAIKSSMPRRLPKSKGKDDFFVVAVGASAGGLEAFKEFLNHLPAEPGMAFVFIQHLSANHKSLLPEILSRLTPMPVKQVSHGTLIKSNTLYIIPPDATMLLKGKSFVLKPRKKSERPHLPIDHFMESIAYELGIRAIGVILSGTGSDGAEGTRIIKAEGGITFAQSPASAIYDSMPLKAIDIDHIDFVLDPKSIASEITHLSKLPSIERIETKIKTFDESEQVDFSKVMLMLRQTSGTDFSHYKPTTIRRRIARRMLLHKLETLGEYYSYLQKNPSERIALNDDVLINVTSFFREPDFYDYLKSHLLPTILKNKPAGQPLRIWSAGCSTGEETYSLAICVLEILGSEANEASVQIFATDLSERCIDKARIGRYLDNITEHVSAERLKKYFNKTDDGYRIAKHVRDLCIFAKHDLTRDPAYSKLDLISCKNLLIYLGQDFQNKVLENFHYSLNRGGYVCLGSSESIGKAVDYFSNINSKIKVYVKKNVSSPLPGHAPLPRREYPTLEARPSKQASAQLPSPYEVQTETDRAILSRFSPPCVVINNKAEILQFRGGTEMYLTHKQGEATLNIFKMIREGLSSELKNAISKARQKDSSYRTERIALKEQGEVRIEVIPLRFLPGERCFLVIFESLSPIEGKVGKGAKKSTASVGNYESILVGQLRQELSSVKDNLQSMIQDFENANQELQSANEEVLSSNEELQSTNEELETSKEELQSTNEELSTVNDELQERNLQLFSSNNDLLNVLNGVQLPIIIVSNDQVIRRYTASASKLFNLIPADVGRPLSHISSTVFDVSMITQQTQVVLDQAIIQESEVLARDNKWYNLRIKPYKTEEQKIEGAVISLHESGDLQSFSDLADTMINLVKEPTVVLDHDQQVISANEAFLSSFKLKMRNIVKHDFLSLRSEWDTSKLRKYLQEISKAQNTNQSTTGYPIIIPGTDKKFILMARKISGPKHISPQILVVFEEEKA